MSIGSGKRPQANRIGRVSQKIPREGEIKRIAHLIYEWELEARHSGDPLRAVVVEKVHRCQRSIAEMRKSLSQILDLALPTAAPGDPAVRRLIDLWNAAILADPYIGPPPKQGRQIVASHVMARALAPLVSAALASAGHQRPSLKPDGPAIKVICRALEHLNGIEHAPAAVASYLKRWQKGARKSRFLTVVIPRRSP